MIKFILILFLFSFFFSQDDFNDWLKKEQSDFQQFINKEDIAFSKFLKNQWVKVDLIKPEKVYKKKKIPVIPIAPIPKKKTIKIKIKKPIRKIYDRPKEIVPISKPVKKKYIEPKIRNTVTKKRKSEKEMISENINYFSFLGLTETTEKKTKISLLKKIDRQSISKYWLLLSKQFNNKFPAL